MRYLGIDPASKKAGIAILDDEELVHFQELNFKTGGTTQGFSEELNRFFWILCNYFIDYDPDLVIIEHTSVNNNLNTTKVLSYFEGVALAAASCEHVEIERMRTTSARKRVLGKGNMKKPEVIHWINAKYNQVFPEDVAEAILFALCGPSIIRERNGKS